MNLIELFAALSFIDKVQFIIMAGVALYLAIGTIVVGIVLRNRPREEYISDWQSIWHNDIKPQLMGVVLAFIWPYVLYLGWFTHE